MPNKFAVYMHDTPEKSLFAASVRFHSHGCVRVGQVKELAAWLLQGTEGPNGAGSVWGPIEIETGIATGERRGYGCFVFTKGVLLAPDTPRAKEPAQ